MDTVVAEEELFRSCRIIFGKDLKVSREFLQYLQLSGIKKAYRLKALEIHPDRESCRELTLQQSLAHQFIDVHEAYKILLAYLEARDGDRGAKAAPTSFFRHDEERRAKMPDHASAGAGKSFFREQTNLYRSSNDKSNGNGRQRKPPLHDLPLDPKSLYTGPMPNCPLLFGRYLYYAGIVSLHTIGQALIWQRAQRPCLGEIGRRLGWLSKQDTYEILRNRRERQLFGESALKLGVLTRGQLDLILLQQKKLHKRIGQYFVAKNYWDSNMLEKFITAHKRHNSRVRDRTATLSARQP
ncbi:MAG: hypothetical protein AMJ60_00830 [Desulfobacterales bacterium SG8_35]|nr:MAG: hypothetical protein AMJ60_00830 [Desulfobacterales bacterium SG8_35]